MNKHFIILIFSNKINIERAHCSTMKVQRMILLLNYIDWKTVNRKSVNFTIYRILMLREHFAPIEIPLTHYTPLNVRKMNNLISNIHQRLTLTRG